MRPLVIAEGAKKKLIWNCCCWKKIKRKNSCFIEDEQKHYQRISDGSKTSVSAALSTCRDGIVWGRQTLLFSFSVALEIATENTWQCATAMVAYQGIKVSEYTCVTFMLTLIQLEDVNVQPVSLKVALQDLKSIWFQFHRVAGWAKMRGSISLSLFAWHCWFLSGFVF